MKKEIRQEENLPIKKSSWISLGFWSIIGVLLGYLLWKFMSYWQRLHAQPLITMPTIPDEDLEKYNTTEEKAFYIATASLQAGIEKRPLVSGERKLVLCAGKRNFREPWARDLSFASFGLVALNQTPVLKESLEAFLLNQRPTGQLPIKLHSTSILDRYLHSLFQKEQPDIFPLKPKYITAYNTVDLDSNAALIIAALNYAQQANDYQFIKTHWTKLKNAITWLISHGTEEDGLLYQEAYADWADSISREGRILYTNVLFWKALQEMAEAALICDQDENHNFLASKAKYIKKSINSHFWRSSLGYYATSHVFYNLSSAGNLLAIAWDLATPEQANSILDKMNDFEMAYPVPTQVVNQSYPLKFISWSNRLGGLEQYHTSNAWLWLGAWHIIALTHMERMEEAKTIFNRLATIIVRDGIVHETYTKEGQPLAKVWYNSEAPFTWNSGMFIYAYHIYQEKAKSLHQKAAI